MAESTIAAPTEDDYKLAVGILIGLVREEFPASLSLTEIVTTWSNPTPEEVEALRRIDGLFPPPKD